MLTREALKDLLSATDRSSSDKLLLCLAAEPEQARPVKAVKQIAKEVGWRIPKTMNVSQLFRRAKDRCVLTPTGWELTTAGRAHVQTLAGPLAGSPAPRVASALRSELAKLSDAQIVAFVEEAIGCVEAHKYRAAVVLSWVGAVAVLQDHVVANHLAAFNAEAARRAAAANRKWKTAVTADDLSRMQEADFLEVLDALSIIGKSVKTQLKTCLDLRNGCGHPNSLQVGEHKVAAHVETLVQNVFAKFA